MPSRVSLSHVYKIFGPNAEQAQKMLEEGASKEEILTRTGNVVGAVDVTFEVKPGEIFVVMGLSGSGKSTLLRCINRLFEPTSGSIHIDDMDITNADPQQLREVRQTKVSMVFQHFALFPHRTVQENVEYGLKVQNIPAEERRLRAQEALDMVGLGEWGGYKPGSLSGGMRQRVGLARALAAGSEVLLMDEAFSALDPLIKREMQDELLNIHKKLGRTIIFITHDLNEALKLGDRTAIMRDGRVEQIGTPQEIISNPASHYIHEFTRDVDRGRVLTLRSVMNPITTVKISEFASQAPLSHLPAESSGECCILMDRGKPVRCVATGSLIDAREAGIGDYTELGLPVEVAPTGTLLVDAFASAAEGRCLVAANSKGEYVGHADPPDILNALIVQDYAEASPVN